MSGIYIHIPFCKQACYYCDFHFSTSLKKKDELVNALIKELELRKEEFQNQSIGTIYFGGGTPSLLTNEELRLLIAEVYKKLIAEGKTNVIIAGTFNAPSYCNSLSPLIQDTDLKDITKHLSFEVDIDKGNDGTYFRLGAYRMGVNIKQKDYMLFSPALFNKMKDSGLNRKAMWPEKHPQWSIYKSVSNRNVAASEHPLVWGRIRNM